MRRGTGFHIDREGYRARCGASGYISRAGATGSGKRGRCADLGRYNLKERGGDETRNTCTESSGDERRDQKKTERANERMFADVKNSAQKVLESGKSGWGSWREAEA
jgi:hypothetical protein